MEDVKENIGDEEEPEVNLLSKKPELDVSNEASEFVLIETPQLKIHLGSSYLTSYALSGTALSLYTKINKTIPKKMGRNSMHD